MMTILEIVLGLVFTFLLLSLLATVIQEMISSLLSLRGKVLLDALAQMLEKHSDNKEVKRWGKLIQETEVYNKYRQQTGKQRTLPSYLTADQVVSVLQELVEEPAQNEAEATARGGLFDAPAKAPADKVTPVAIKDRDLRNSLMALKVGQKREAQVARGLFIDEGPAERNLGEALPRIQGQVEEAKHAIAENFNGMMDRAAGWYKRRVQLILFFVGLVIAFSFDADAFEIYRNLSENSEARREVIAAAQAYIASAPADLGTDTTAARSLADLRGKVDSLVNKEIEASYSALGLGRATFPEMPPNHQAMTPTQLVSYRATKFFGWIVTTLAITLGAPFWFDLLKLLMNVRNAGKPPASGGRPASSGTNR